MTRPVRIALGCALFVGCVGGLGCERKPSGRGGGPTAQPGELQRVAGVIAGARCARGELCREIEPGGPYPDRAACLHDQQLVFQQELNGVVCRRGVDQTNLARCLQDQGNETCDSRAPTGPIPSCRSEVLCVK